MSYGDVSMDMQIGGGILSVIGAFAGAIVRGALAVKAAARGRALAVWRRGLAA